MAEDMAVVAVGAAGMAVAEIGTALVGMAAAVVIGTGVEAAGMPVVVIGTAVAGMVEVVAGIVVVTVGAGELDPP
jgi:hypothetical protein